MMEMIDINEVLAQSPVVENLKNFAGVDPNNKMGLMTPEKLASVVGEKIGIKTLRFVLSANNKYNIDIRYGILIIKAISIEGKSAMYSLDIQQSTSSTICPNQVTVLGEKSGKLSIIFDSELKRWVLLNKYGIDIEVWFTLIGYGK